MYEGSFQQSTLIYLYKQTIQSISNAVILYNNDNELIGCNNACMQMHGVETENSFISLFEDGKEDIGYADLKGIKLSRYNWPHEKIRAGEKINDWIVETCLPNGRKSWFGRYSSQTIIGENGLCLFKLITIEDVSKEFKLKKKLEAQQRMFESIFENAPAGLALFEATAPYKVIMHNEVYQQYFPEPYKSKGMQNLPLEKYLQTAEADGIFKFFEKAINTKQSQTIYNFEYHGMERGTTWWNWSFTPVIEQDRVVYIVHMAIEVTEQFLLQKKTSENEKLLSNIIDSSPGNISIKDVNGNYITINKSLEKLLGHSREELAGKSDFDIYPHDKALQYQEQDLKIVKTKQAMQIERVHTAESSLENRTYLVNKYPIFSANGDVFGIGSIAQDITARKQMEADLEDARQRLLMAKDAAKLGIHEYNPISGEIFWDDRVKEIFGIDKDVEIDFDLFMKGILPEDHDIVNHAVEHALRPENGYYYAEYRVKNFKDQRLRWVSATGNVFFKDGKAVRLIGTAQDITRYKILQEELGSREQRLRLATDAAEMGIFTIDLENNNSYWENAYMYKIFGLKKNQKPYSLPEFLENIILPDDENAFRDAFQAAMHQKKQFVIQCRFVREIDKQLRWIEIFGSFIYGHDNKPLQLVGVIDDITQRKTAEDKLKESENRYRMLAANLPNGAAFVLDKNLRYVLAAGKALELAGFKSEYFEGKTIYELKDTDQLSFYEANFNNALNGESYKFEHSNHGRFYASELVPLYNNRNEIDHVLAVSYDITDRIKSEEKLRESESLYRAIAENFPDGAIYIFDREMRFKLAQGSALNNIGFTSEMLEGKTVDEATSGRLNALLNERYPRVLEGEKLYFETSFKGRYLSSDYVPIRNNKGDVIAGMVVSRDITLQKKAEDRLKESENNFRDLADNVSQFVWMADKEGSIFWYNKRWYDFTGTNLEEMRGWGWIKVHHPQHVDRVVDSFGTAVKSGSLWEDVFPIKSKHGEYRWFLSRAIPLRNEEGEVEKWFGTNTDITDYRNLEQELRNERELLQTVFDSIPVMLTIWDPTLKVTTLNKAIERITGWTEEDLSKEHIMELVYPNPEYRQKVADYMASLAPGFKDIKMTAKDGHIIESSWANLSISDGRNIGIGIDISERKRFEKQLAGLTSRLQSVVENISDGVLIFSPGGTLLEQNKAAEEISSFIFNGNKYKYDNIELINSNGQIIQAENWPLNRVLKGEKVTREIYKVINKEYNREIYIEYSGTPIFSNNEIAFIVLTMHDVTENKKSEMQVLRANQDLSFKNNQLVKMNQLNENLLYIIAHDLRGPIANMHSIINIWPRLQDEQRKKDMFEALKEMVVRQDNTVNGLVEIIQVQSPEELESSKIDLKEVIEDVIKDHKNLLTKTKSKLVYDFSEVPHIHHIRTFVHSIIKNLVSNAIKYRKADTMLVVKVTSRRVRGYVEIEIEDNGMGIDLLKHGNNLFQPFKRFHPKVKGTGIGLYIIKNLLEKNGGYIEVKSNSGTGTCFYCYFKEYS